MEYADEFIEGFFFLLLRLFLIVFKQTTGKPENMSTKYRLDTICYRNVTDIKIIRALLRHEQLFTDQTKTFFKNISVSRPLWMSV